MSAAAQKEKTAPNGLTPVMAQYVSLKEQHPDCVVLFRLGDFYEIFFDDAPIVAKALGIQLTRRSKQGGEDIPMCGIPWHQLDAYLPDLLKAGLSVALCEQLESPAEAKQRGSKAPLRRGITRLITPGTAVEDILLSGSEQRLLVAIAPEKNHLGLAWCDVAGGSVTLADMPLAAALDWLHTLNPAEIIAPASWTEASSLLGALAPRLHPQAQGLFKLSDAESRLAQHYGLFSMAAYGVFPARALAAGAAAVSYIKHTQQASPVALRPPVLWREQERLHIDAATVRNLELLQSSSGNARHSLLSAVDNTVSSAGTRLLKDWLLSPLQDIQAIGQRQDAVAYLLSNPALTTKLRETLKKCGDVERAVTRLRMRRGAPRDLVAISETLGHIEILAGHLASVPDRPALLQSLLAALPIGLALTERLENALETPPPPTSRDGGLIRAHYHPRVDELRLAKNDSARLIAQLEGRYKTEHSVSTLKIRHNNLIGYHIEVPLKHADALFSVFQHRATMASVARFTSPELQELERLILSGSGELIDLEHTLFEELIEAALKHQDQLWTAAQALAALDVLCSFAVLAEQRGYCRPVVDESTCFDIVGGRHPVVETLLPSTAPFISNDCSLSLPQRLWLLTGPNMAGKSTFLRQNALIALLAHMGCFVPAASARIGLIDRIFSRVGAGDDLARGQSTFMVEMLETAAILNQAKERSLVILDEVGRGTATHDGLSLATAVVEYIHDACRCRALFATHYHELEQLETRLPQLANYHAAVDFYRGDLVFLHTIKRGAARASYGLHIGRKAGLPKRVLERAEAVLAALEKNQSVLVADDAPLFSVAPTTPTATAPAVHPLLLALESLNPDTLSAREALDTLYAWKQTYA